MDTTKATTTLAGYVHGIPASRVTRDGRKVVDLILERRGKPRGEAHRRLAFVGDGLADAAEKFLRDGDLISVKAERRGGYFLASELTILSGSNPARDIAMSVVPPAAAPAA